MIEMTAHTRMPPKARQKLLLEYAIEVAVEKGFRGFSRDDVAEKAGVSAGLVSTRFGSMEKMRTAIMREAVKRPLLPIVLAGLVEGHKVALAAPDDVKDAARRSLG